MDLLGTERREVLAKQVVGRLDTLNSHLKTLSELYAVELTSKGIIHPDIEGEGEVVETDDTEVALLIERLRAARPDRQGKGLYIGDEKEAWGDGSPVIPEPLPTDRDALFGGGWGFNVGPEGAEKDWSGPDSDGGPPKQDPGDVRGHSSGEVKEG